MDDATGSIGYWLPVAAGELPYGGALAHMGLELSSIPAMCAEAEHVFDGYVLLSRWPQFAPLRQPLFSMDGCKSCGMLTPHKSGTYHQRSRGGNWR